MWFMKGIYFYHRLRRTTILQNLIMPFREQHGVTHFSVLKTTFLYLVIALTVIVVY